MLSVRGHRGRPGPYYDRSTRLFPGLKENAVIHAAIRSVHRASRLGTAALLGVIVGTASLAGSALARQNDQGQAAAPQTPQTMLLLDYAGPSSLFASPKDAALSRALGMIPARVEELLKQVPDLSKAPRPAIDLAMGVLSHPVRIAITNKGFDPQTGMPGFGGVVSFSLGDGGEAAARAMHKNFEFVRRQAAPAFQPAPSKKFEGLTDLPLPMGVLSYGARKAPDGWRYELIFAAIDDPDAPFKGLAAAPQGVEPTMRGRVDVAAWGPIIQMFGGFVSMASPQGKEAMKELRESGLIGPDAVSVDFVQGYSADASTSLITVHKLGKFAERLGVSRDKVTTADLAAIPADATAAMVQKSDLKRTWESLKQQAAAAGGAQHFDDALRQIQSETGVDVEQDIIATLGSTAIVYVSDSTGGGSILSTVALLAIEDTQKLSGALAKLTDRANALLKQAVPPPARVELAKFDADGVSYTQLRFPGLPVPLEVTCAIAGKWLVLGATPQAATAAAMQAKSGTAKNGLESNAAFAGARWSGHDATSLTFVDSARTLRDGYPIITLLGSMVANATRSDQQGGRDAGMVVPGFATLRDGVRGSVSVTYWQGDDWFMERRGDRSMLVNAAGMLGVADLGELVAGALIGGGIGAQAANEASKHRGWDHPSAQPADDADDHEEHSESHDHRAPAKDKNRRNVPY